ncbi:lasso peptide biosynthesis B2 protein [Microbispora sp. ZYX-F-249]|uniref:Lasso peptide biosynthesis B2 protein n=1 Tax=Microbispora maris TaxID=3144104 RepID=A0ABV0AKV3_9ACTN
MSPKLVTLETAERPPWRLRPPALLAMGLAWPLARCSPYRLRRLLEIFSRGARPATEHEAERARGAVVGMGIRLAGPRCLERSIATALLCRLSGGWPEWCTGVSTHPFEAHAWVEVNGKPIGENPAEIAHFFVTMKVAVHDAR